MSRSGGAKEEPWLRDQGSASGWCGATTASDPAIEPHCAGARVLDLWCLRAQGLLPDGLLRARVVGLRRGALDEWVLHGERGQASNGQRYRGRKVIGEAHCSMGGLAQLRAHPLRATSRVAVRVGGLKTQLAGQGRNKQAASEGGGGGFEVDGRTKVSLVCVLEWIIRVGHFAFRHVKAVRERGSARA